MKNVVVLLEITSFIQKEIMFLHIVINKSKI